MSQWYCVFEGHPKAQNISGMEGEFHRKWQHISQQQNQRVVQSMGRRLREVINVREGQIRY